jgi:hypothetical protein
VSCAGPPVGGGARELLSRSKAVIQAHHAPDKANGWTAPDLYGMICSQCSQSKTIRSHSKWEHFSSIFINGDNGLGNFQGFVPSVPTFSERHPEADQAKTQAEAARRPAGLALVGVQVAPPLAGPSGAPSDAGRFNREKVLAGRRLKKLTDWLTRVIRIDAGPLHALECMGRGVKKSAGSLLETDRLAIFSRAQVSGGRGTPSCMMVQPGWWPAPALAPDCGPT